MSKVQRSFHQCISNCYSRLPISLLQLAVGSLFLRSLKSEVEKKTADATQCAQWQVSLKQKIKNLTDEAANEMKEELKNRKTTPRRFRDLGSEDEQETKKKPERVRVPKKKQTGRKKACRVSEEESSDVTFTLLEHMVSFPSMSYGVQVGKNTGVYQGVLVAISYICSKWHVCVSRYLLMIPGCAVMLMVLWV